MTKVKKKTLNLFMDIMTILAPPPKLTVSEWADTYRKLSAESSAEPGQWKTSRAPYQKGIMDALSNKETENIVVMSSAQVGKTELINNIIGYFIDYDPSPIMLLMPTIDLAQSYSKKRLAPMIRDTPTLREKVKDAKSRDSDNTLMEKGFPGGYIALTGANSPTGLSSRPIRILLADEVDRFPVSAGIEGDPLSLAEKRTKTFWNKKKFFVSTPTEKGISRIEKEYEKSSKEEWCLPCPKCGKHQPLTWAQIVFEDITHECKYCKERSTEFEWKKGKGKWIADCPENIKRRGFHLNALASPWETWENIIEEFKEAKKNGPEALKTWVNTTLGESWEDNEGEGADNRELLSRREEYESEVPNQVLILTAGVDVQDDRLELEVVGWGVGKESWGIEYKVFYGDPGQDIVWNMLDQELDRTFLYENGEGLKIICTCIDSGGHYTTEVYKFCKIRESRRVFAIKGIGGYGKPFINKATRNNRERAALFSIGVDAGKEVILARLKIKDEGPHYCHFPINPEKGYTPEYFEALTSEKRVIKYKKGIATFEWVKKNSTIRNEAFDLRNYANAAIEILNPNLEEMNRRNLNGNIYIQAPRITKRKRKYGR
ncbi:MULTISPECIES: phage terminase large subunit family protein [Clostridium]|uniref:Phage terminase GpA n=1 Tax=Clostridium carnis TaxID=1530 RepID=A0ABY6SRG4_9CLOT|nr:phage terminase large subunit family protein [Clostridium carnis]CAI3560616.1 terminase, large subunit [Clostridium neonatale]CAI3561964.1 terminase, large subunit [Clostridium neonatale]CAI3582891.1 terminase, large subunit [Clostridium neonatale]CAI3622643.1 terminase, large subunit [Clostridium neonatale]CAI3675410.1 terminase, large subunit [Clostridium neonatale]